MLKDGAAPAAEREPGTESDPDANPDPEPFGRVRAGRLIIASSLREAITGIGWIDFDSGAGQTNLHLPTDLFILSLRWGVHEGAGRSGIVAVVYSVRDTLRSFTLGGRRQVVAAALTPAGMLKAFGFPPADVVDRPIPLEALCGDAAALQLAAALHAAQTLDQRAKCFASWLELRMAGAKRLSSSALRVAHAASEWAIDPAALSTQALARKLGVAVRQIERDFQSALRISPGAFRRIVKFQRAAADVARGRRLVDVAAEHAFADQAHMSNVFRQFASLSPRKVAAFAAGEGREAIHTGLAGRVFLLDVPQRPAAGPTSTETDSPLSHAIKTALEE